MYTTRISPKHIITTPLTPPSPHTHTHQRWLFPGEPPAAAAATVEMMRRPCVGELLAPRPHAAPIAQPSAVISRMFSHTSWTYMYQGFDIFAIFSAGPPLEVVSVMSRGI